jgi:site-specific recombinase XerD
VHLEKYLASRNDDCEALFVRYKKKDGKIERLLERGIEKEIHNIGIAAGIEVNVFPHALRHTFSSVMVAHGLDVFSLSNMLGHSMVSTTQAYIDVSKEKLQADYKKHMVG